jgi:RNA polymerase sigma-70 factor, ECF subfamily
VFLRFSSEGWGFERTIGTMDGSLALARHEVPEAVDAPGLPGYRSQPATSGVFETPAAAQRSWQDTYEEHADFVWRIVKRLGLSNEDAEDALHEVFLVAYTRRDAFDPERGSMRSWLFGITSNVVRTLRKRSRRAGVLLDPTDETVRGLNGKSALGGGSGGSNHTADGSRSAEVRELKGALLRAIDTLSPEHRVVFEMFELEGLGCAAIAEDLQIPVGTVYSRLHKARDDLRQALKDHAIVRGGSR